MTTSDSIPPLTSDGLLPEGIHTCLMTDVSSRFGKFQRSDRRIQLTEKLKEFIHELQETGLVTWVGVDGSYVTDKAEPGDIDLVVVLKPDFDGSQPIQPSHYNALSKRRIQTRFGFDILAAPENSPALEKHLSFFQCTRDGLAKGLLKVEL